MGLSLQREPLGVTLVRDELRIRITEQYEHVPGGTLPSAVKERHTMIWDLLFDDRKPDDCRRRNILEQLFNHDLRVIGQVRHNEIGCCRSEKHGLRTMVKYGVDAHFSDRHSHHAAKRLDWSIRSFERNRGIHNGAWLITANIPQSISQGG